jgi:hypothetical protein
LLSNCLFAVFTLASQETKFLFKFPHQDWNGRYVMVLNPVHKDAVIQEKVAWLHFKEILIPIPDQSSEVYIVYH